MKEMQDAGIIVSAEEMQQLLRDSAIRQWLADLECLHYPGEPAEFGIPLPPDAPPLPERACTPLGEELLGIAATRQP